MNQNTRLDRTTRTTILMAVAIAAFTLLGAFASPAHAGSAPPGDPKSGVWWIDSTIPASAGYRLVVRPQPFDAKPTGDASPVYQGRIAELHWNSAGHCAVWEVHVYDKNNHEIGFGLQRWFASGPQFRFTWYQQYEPITMGFNDNTNVLTLGSR